MVSITIKAKKKARITRPTDIKTSMPVHWTRLSGSTDWPRSHRLPRHLIRLAGNLIRLAGNLRLAQTLIAFPSLIITRVRQLSSLAHERLDQVDRYREDGCGVVLRRNFNKGLQVAQLQCHRLGSHDVGRQGQLLRGLELAFGGDDLGAAFALGLGLFGHGPLHRLGNLHVLHFHGHDLDSPRGCLFVDYMLKMQVDLVPFGQQVVQVRLAQGAPQGRLGDLGGGDYEILDLDDCLGRLHHPEVDDGVDLGGYVVAGDYLLGRNVHGDDSLVYFDHAVYKWYQQEEARALGVYEPPQPEDHPAFIFSGDSDRRE